MRGRLALSPAARLEPQLMQPRIQPLARHQFGVRALLGDAALLHDDDAVGVFDGGQAVRDDQRGAVLHQPGQRLLDETLRFRVERARRLVEKQDRRILQDRTGDGNSLALAAGELLAALAEIGPDLICLAGFMRVLSAGFIAEWPDQILNIHPSLLPAFRGLNVQAQALAAGVKLSGCTVHIVRPALDDGPIIAQAAVPVLPDDDVEKLTARILAAEHQLYPAALALIASKTAVVRGDKVEIAADFQGLSAKALFSFTL